MPELDADLVERVSRRLLEQLGVPADISLAVAGWLVRSDLSGHHSHGVAKVTDYAGRIRRGELVPSGRPRVVRDEEQLVLVDGGHGFGHPAAQLLTRELVRRSREVPIAVGGIINASHTGRLGEWAELAAESGAILFMCSASVEQASVAPYGGREPALGTNPLTFGVPASGHDSLILDFATSAIAGAKTKHLMQTGSEAPKDSLLDRDGEPTTSPAALQDGGMLLPFGGHKGYGLSVALSVLSGCVVGVAGDDPRKHGVLAIAIDPGLFAPREAVLEAVRRQLDRMRATPPRQGFERVEVPGDVERRARGASGEQLLLPDATWESLLTLGRSLGLKPEDLIPA